MGLYGTHYIGDDGVFSRDSDVVLSSYSSTRTSEIGELIEFTDY